MNLFADMKALVLTSLNTLAAAGTLPKGLDYTNVTVEPPRDAGHGDMATNASMVLSKAAGMNPRAIAEALAEQLIKDDFVISANVAGPGFLNMNLKADFWRAVVPAALVA